MHFNNGNQHLGHNNHQHLGHNNQRLGGDINQPGPLDHPPPAPDMGAGQGQNMPGVFDNNKRPLETQPQRPVNNDNNSQVRPVSHPSSPTQAVATDNALEEMFQALSAEQGYGYQPYMYSQLPNFATHATPTQQQQLGPEVDPSYAGMDAAAAAAGQNVYRDVDVGGNDNSNNQLVGGDQQPQQHVGINDNNNQLEPESVAQ